MGLNEYRELAVVPADPPEPVAPVAPNFEERKARCPACGEYAKTTCFARGPHRYGFLRLRRCDVAGPHVHQRCHEGGALVFDGGCGCTWTAATPKELTR